MSVTKVFLDNDARARVFPFGSTAAGDDALVTVHKGTLATSAVVLDVKASATIAGDLNLGGNLNITGSINTTTVTNTNVIDVNLTLNDGGTTAGASGIAGINIEGDAGAVIGRLVFDNALNSKWKIGDNTTQLEIVTVSGAQTLTNKTIGGSQISGNIAGNAANVTGTVAVGNGGTGATTFTAGYLKANGTAAFTTVASIAGADVSGNIAGNAANVTGTVAIGNGGTGQTTATAAFNALSPITTLGDLIYGSGANTSARLAGNTTATRMWLAQTGNGSVSAAPVWAAIAATDIPTLNQNTTGTAANVTGTVAIANGGTGQTAKAAAYDALNPNTTLGDITYRGASNNVRLAGNTTAAKQFLTQTGTGAVSAAPIWGAIAASDVPTLNQNTTGTAANVTGTVAVSNGGTGKTSLAVGSLLYGAGGGTAMTELVASTNGYVLTLAGGVPTWAAPTGSAAYMHEVTVSGTQDGANKTFTLASAVTAGSLLFMINGVVRKSGAGNDYTVSGTTVTLTAGHPAPSATDSIYALGIY